MIDLEEIYAVLIEINNRLNAIEIRLDESISHAHDGIEACFERIEKIEDAAHEQ